MNAWTQVTAGANLPARGDAAPSVQNVTLRAPGATFAVQADSRGGRENPSRKVRTPQGKVVGNPTRGNPRESATETHRRWRGLT